MTAQRPDWSQPGGVSGFLQQITGPGDAGMLVGDAEREQVAAVLGDHFTAGRLTHGEYDDRLNAAYAARTRGQLTGLLRDLPAPRTDLSTRYLVPRAVSQVPAKQPSRVPFMPALLLLIGLTLLLDSPAVMLLGLAVLLWAKHLERVKRFDRVRRS